MPKSTYCIHECNERKVEPHNFPYYAIYEYKTERKLNENKVIKSADTFKNHNIHVKMK